MAELAGALGVDYVVAGSVGRPGPVCGTAAGADAVMHVTKAARGTVRVELQPPANVDGFIDITGDNLSCDFVFGAGCRNDDGAGATETFVEGLAGPDGFWFYFGFAGANGEARVTVTFTPE